MPDSHCGAPLNRQMYVIPPAYDTRLYYSKLRFAMRRFWGKYVQ